MNVFGRSTNEADLIADQNYIWSDGQDHSWETRSWAELAYWYPAFTVPAGAQNVSALANSRDFDITKYGASDEGGVSFLSHGYLKAKDFPTVFGAFAKIRDLLEEK